MERIFSEKLFPKKLSFRENFSSFFFNQNNHHLNGIGGGFLIIKSDFVFFFKKNVSKNKCLKHHHQYRIPFGIPIFFPIHCLCHCCCCYCLESLAENCHFFWNENCHRILYVWCLLLSPIFLFREKIPNGNITYRPTDRNEM